MVINSSSSIFVLCVNGPTRVIKLISNRFQHNVSGATPNNYCFTGKLLSVSTIHLWTSGSFLVYMTFYYRQIVNSIIQQTYATSGYVYIEFSCYSSQEMDI